MMERQYLIIGHGLAGCVLALTFLRRKIPFQLIGTSQAGEASMASSGLITPVTGRKYVKSWMIDEFIDSALDFYRWTEEELWEPYFFPVDIVRFLSHPEALIAWEMRKSDPEYARYISDKRYEELDRLQKPYGILTGGYRLDTRAWILDVRSYLSRKGLFTESFYNMDEKKSEAQTIIYATGAIGTGVSNGIIPNKGEALIVKIPGWRIPGIMKEDVFFVPLKEKDMFWVGSYYQPWASDLEPSEGGKQHLMHAIEKVYQAPFEVVEHLSGVRPTVADRRPLIGALKGQEGRYIFNGMGTKGTSLAPYWAAQLVSHLVEGTTIPQSVSPSRFSHQQSG